MITVLTFSDGILFRTKKFIPDYRYTLNFVDAWSVDEVVILDVSRRERKLSRSFKEVVQKFAKACFVPIAVGGNIRSVSDVREYLDVGADKVVLNSGAIDNPDLINSVARSFGRQCVVQSIDTKKEDSRYVVYGDCGRKNTGMGVVEWSRHCEELGAGELMLNSIERDGSLQGYDLDLCKSVSDAVNIPVLICGGAGNWRHFEDGFVHGNADAVCTNNIYHFTEASINSAKLFLQRAGVNVRV